jgi:hypothetical protein
MHARLAHFQPEIVALAGALADAAEHRVAAVLLGDVVDQLLDEHGLADAGAAEEADLAAAGVRGEQVDDLDAGLERLDLGRLVGERRCRAMDRVEGLGLDRAGLVDRLADDVDDAAERLRADRHLDVVAGVLHVHAAHEPLGGVHGDRADRVLAEVLRDLEHEIPVEAADRRIRHSQRLIDRRQLAGRELDVDDRTDDLRDLTEIHVRAL